MTEADRFDLSAHTGSRLEWWFFHGRLAGVEVEERYFMLTLFRYQIRSRGSRPIAVFAALIATLDPRTGRQWTSNLVDRRILEVLNREDAANEVDPYSAPAILDEIRRWGLPREFECPEGEIILTGNPLHIQWADLHISAESQGAVLAFREPEASRRLTLNLEAVSPLLSIDDPAVAEDPDEAMRCVTCPEMSLTGDIDGLPITGEAWFDQQWGGLGWLRSPGSPRRMRGWDWLGFRLDDGSAGVLTTHWETATRQEFARQITLRDSSGMIRRSKSFEWAPSRWWTSTATRINHPVAWNLRISEWDADLSFEPLADNQEIRVLGPIRAIWEGAGRISGQIRGRPVQGAARLEGQGRGFVLDSRSYLHSWAVLVDRELARFLPKAIEEHDVCRYAGPPEWAYEPASYTSMLSEPIWDLVGRSGKRWRAVFACLLLDALGRDPEPLLDVETVLPELLHSASLIIDDIQDGSHLRRGSPAIHRRHGLDVAISAANTAYFLPLLVVLDHPVLTREEKQGICELYQRQLVRAHLGQSLDLFWTRSLTRANLDGWMADSIGPKIIQMYSLKTGAPVESVAETALLLAGSSPEVRRVVLRFARSFGLAFQLVDDVKDFLPTPGWGKRRGEDLRSGKLTYVILRALERLEPAARASLREILCRPDLRADEESIRRGIGLVIGSGACQSVRDEARAQVTAAWDALSRLVPPSCPKTELRFLWESLIDLSVDDSDPPDSPA